MTNIPKSAKASIDTRGAGRPISVQKIGHRALSLVVALLLSGCSMLGTATDGANKEVNHFEGETETYEVQVRIVTINGLCDARRITLMPRSKLHIKPTVRHVEAYDHGCNNVIDQLRFRNSDDLRRIDEELLRQDIWYAFHWVVVTE